MYTLFKLWYLWNYSDRDEAKIFFFFEINEVLEK